MRRRIGLAFLLVPPLAWLVVAYLGSLAVLLVSVFWTHQPSFTARWCTRFTTDNVVRAFTERSPGRPRCVPSRLRCWSPVICIVLAVPLALYMAKVASPRVRVLLVDRGDYTVVVSYLVKAYALHAALPRTVRSPGRGGYTPGYGLVATVITLTYLWLPYMIIPVFAAFDRVPDSLIDASSDLGASDFATMRMVMAPLVFPGIAAGSIFTFSLSLGDYIAVTIVGGKNSCSATSSTASW